MEIKKSRIKFVISFIFFLVMILTFQNYFIENTINILANRAMWTENQDLTWRLDKLNTVYRLNEQFLPSQRSANTNGELTSINNCVSLSSMLLLEDSRKKNKNDVFLGTLDQIKDLDQDETGFLEPIILTNGVAILSDSTSSIMWDPILLDASPNFWSSWDENGREPSSTLELDFNDPNTDIDSLWITILPQQIPDLYWDMITFSFLADEDIIFSVGSQTPGKGRTWYHKGNGNSDWQSVSIPLENDMAWIYWKFGEKAEIRNDDIPKIVSIKPPKLEYSNELNICN